jgi:acylphosphatase
VEIEAFGDEEKLKKFVSEITRTDRMFSVSGLETEAITDRKGYRDFTIRFY